MMLNRGRSGPRRTAAGLPSPRLTFTGRFRAGKAPEVLAMAPALLAAPPPAYLVDHCPTARQ